MKHIPILFSTPMVQAIIDGRKTQTRRVIKSPFQEWITDKNINSEWAKDIDKNCPYGQPGDVLWVRESFQKRSDRALELGFDRYYYKAGWEGCTDGGWKPGIHMPKTACRIWLQVVSVKAERLQDIREDDAIAEGVQKLSYGGGSYKNYCPSFRKDGGVSIMQNAISSFLSLWESINGGQYIFDNPWVWRIEFKRIEKPENFI